MKQSTLLSDPIYGLIEIPSGLLQQLCNHPYVQRLRRISQLAFTQYVYPGATHHRFQHALGALHLMQQALNSLRQKGVEISQAEYEGACAAILLHDLGHGPFSHSLEQVLLPVAHEWLSLRLMEAMNKELDGALDTALAIFQGKHPKRFLHQLVSSQLDMDRMDYLSRDSFYTGVHEGVVGYNRLIYMLDVREQDLVIAYKGIYSVEKFLIARRLMYWQVYLHKTVIVAGEMLKQALRRAKFLLSEGQELGAISPDLAYFLQTPWRKTEIKEQEAEVLAHFTALDDTDIWQALKVWAKHPDFILRFLSESLLHRRLFKIQLREEPFTEAEIQAQGQKLLSQANLSESDLSWLLLRGEETNKAYRKGRSEIKILLNSGEVEPISKWSEHHIPHQEVHKYYLAYPKFFLTLPRLKHGLS